MGVGAMDRAVSDMARARATLLKEIPAFDRAKAWKREGATSMSGWLCARYGFAWSRARELVRVARALESLPAISEAHGSGRLSWDQVRPVTRFATPATDEAWAARAQGMRPSTLWKESRRHERERARKDREARAMRSLTFTADPELPVVWLQGCLPAEEGAIVQGAVEAAAEGIELADAPVSPGEARLADGLVALCQGAGTPATLVVHTGAEVLAGAGGGGPVLAETESGMALTAEAVRRLACDSKVEWHAESEDGAVGIGRKGRAVPGWLLRALRHRDEGRCRFPGCEHRRWLHAHHLVHWADGGPTDLSNLVLLCSGHHRLLHEEGWRTSGDPGKDLRFHDPTGRPLARGPTAAAG